MKYFINFDWCGDGNGRGEEPSPKASVKFNASAGNFACWLCARYVCISLYGWPHSWSCD
jgi:hypothetical protein